MQRCSVCIHPDRAEIDRLLISGTALRDLAGQYGLSRSALHRHKDHIPAALVVAQEAEAAADADNLLQQLEALQVKAVNLLEQAEAAGDLRTALTGVREARACLELLAKLQGELWERQEIDLRTTPTPQGDLARRVMADPVASDMAHRLLERIAGAGD